MIRTPTEARRFFVDRVLAEARHQGLALTVAEQQMLGWSESAPDSTADPALVDRLAAEVSDEDYESKVGSLLAAALARDLQADKHALDDYRRAHALLRQGDYYILVMIDRALGRRLRPWWKFPLG
jgi:hypothetical protein